MSGNEKIIAVCGLDCAQCMAYKATVKNDDDMRKETAKNWSAMYGGEIDWKSINCLGCTQDVTVFGYCGMCEIRKCAKGRGFSTCAVCPDFGCEKLAEFWKNAPEAKTNLESLNG